MKRIFSTTLTICTALATVASAQQEALFRTNSSEYENIKITKVVSADTIVLENDERIKLIGLNAPEAPKRKEAPQRDQRGFIIEERVSSPIIPIEERAYIFAKELLLDQYVRLEFDQQKRNDDFKTVAYVFLKNGTFANREILRQGFANLQIRPPNLKYAEELREAYREARREKRGLQGE